MDQDFSRTRPLLLSKLEPKVPRPPASAEGNIDSGSGSLPRPKITKIRYKKIQVPAPGTPVPESVVRRAGPFLLGPKVGPSPVKSIVQCLARKEKTDDFYLAKILTLRKEGHSESQDDRQGKMLLHTEYSLLSLLKDQNGVIQHHGLYKDSALEEIPNPHGPGYIYTGKVRDRLMLVLDCVTAHQYSEIGSELINLQQYVTKVKKVPEKKALTIFYDIMKVVCELHKRNIVHRDIKLGNIILNQRTCKVIFTNFCLGTHLGSDKDLLKDQRGSPAYISPDVLLCKPYLGKPSDMWALGVVLYTMLYGQFPFCDTSLAQLFSRISAANYNIPPDGNTAKVSDSTVFLIQRLLVKDPKHRMLADEVLDQLSGILANYVHVPRYIEDNQVVPDIPLPEDNEKEKKKVDAFKPSADEETKTIKVEDKEAEPSLKEDKRAFCIPLPEWYTPETDMIFPPPPLQSNTSIVQPCTSMDSTSITSPSTPIQRQITVQRIGRDARALAPSEIARYQQLLTVNAARVLGATARADTQNIVPEPRLDRPESSRVRAHSNRIHRFTNTSGTSSTPGGRSVPATVNSRNSFTYSPRSTRELRLSTWSERARSIIERSPIDRNYMVRLKNLRQSVYDLSRVPACRASSTVVSGDITDSATNNNTANATSVLANVTANAGNVSRENANTVGNRTVNNNTSSATVGLANRMANTANVSGETANSVTNRTANAMPNTADIMTDDEDNVTANRSTADRGAMANRLLPWSYVVDDNNRTAANNTANATTNMANTANWSVDDITDEEDD